MEQIPLAEMRNISKRFGVVIALDSVEFTIHSGKGKGVALT